jgi:hypothetical protein
MSPLRWSSKRTEKLAAALRAEGFSVSADTVGEMLTAQGYSLQATRKTLEGGDHPDRDAQFQHIASEVTRIQSDGQPVISVDCKKKELIGPFKNAGREWQLAGKPEAVNVYPTTSPPRPSESARSPTRRCVRRSPRPCAIIAPRGRARTAPSSRGGRSRPMRCESFRASVRRCEGRPW